MTRDEKVKKAKMIKEKLENVDYPYHMARTMIDYDISILGDDKKEIFELVKKLMN